jgi:PPOX class probable F420-dependent enzyme
MNMSPTTTLDRTWAMLLRTRRRNGEWVDTPVNVAVEGDRAFFGTPANSGKVKRLRNFDSVEVGPCSVRGRLTGATFTGRARRLEGDEAAEAERRLRAKYPFVYRVSAPIEHRLKRTHGLFFELSELRPAG